MKVALLPLICCPGCRGDLSLDGGYGGDAGEIESGSLRCLKCGGTFAIVDSVPRFVPAENYANNFGLQWNAFRRTQLDSHTGVPISRDRFFAQSGWSPGELADKLVLDVGCGAGRFAEVALSSGCRLVALDYSSAVDACWQNLKQHRNLDVVQGDVYRLPFRAGIFDYVYCFGVLQHTPDVHKAFLSLPPMLKPRGRLAVDVYPKQITNLVWPKYWLRPMTRRMPAERLFSLVRRWTPAMLAISDAIGKIPGIGLKARRLVPVSNYRRVYQLSEQQLKEWAVLDTFDMLAPAHDHPQSASTLAAWFAEAGLLDVRILRTGHLAGRGVKPAP